MSIRQNERQNERQNDINSSESFQFQMFMDPSKINMSKFGEIEYSITDNKTVTEICGETDIDQSVNECVKDSNHKRTENNVQKINDNEINDEMTQEEIMNNLSETLSNKTNSKKQKSIKNFKFQNNENKSESQNTNYRKKESINYPPNFNYIPPSNISIDPHSNLNKNNINDVNNTFVDSKIAKYDLLMKLSELQSKGIKLSSNYDMNSDYITMKTEYDMHMNHRKKFSGIKIWTSFLTNGISILELANNHFNPFDIQLDGWGNQVKNDLEDNYDVLSELHDKYIKSGGKGFSPEVTLIYIIIGSAVSLHIKNSFGLGPSSNDNNIQKMKQKDDQEKEAIYSKMKILNKINEDDKTFKSASQKLEQLNIIDNKPTQKSFEQFKDNPLFRPSISPNISQINQKTDNLKSNINNTHDIFPINNKQNIVQDKKIQQNKINIMTEESFGIKTSQISKINNDKKSNLSSEKNEGNKVNNKNPFAEIGDDDFDRFGNFFKTDNQDKLSDISGLTDKSDKSKRSKQSVKKGDIYVLK